MRYVFLGATVNTYKTSESESQSVLQTSCEVCSGEDKELEGAADTLPNMNDQALTRGLQ